MPIGRYASTCPAALEVRRQACCLDYARSWAGTSGDFLQNQPLRPACSCASKAPPATASVYDLGLDNQTIADGLAVAQASDFAFNLIGTQVMGGYTVTD